MVGYSLVENTADPKSVAAVEIKDAFSDGVGWLVKITDNPASLAVMSKECDIGHLVYPSGRPDKGEHHLPIWPCRTLPEKEFYLVCFRWVFMFLLGHKHCKTAVDALGTLAAMRVK